MAEIPPYAPALNRHLRMRMRFAKLFGVSGVACLIFGGWFTIQTKKFLHTAVPTTGHIIAIKEETSGEDTMYSPVYSFTTTNDEAVQAKSSLSRSTPVYKIGDPIEILYDPSHPQDSKEKNTFAIWGAPIVSPLMGVVTLAISGMMYWRSKRLLDQLLPKQPDESSGQ